MTQTGFNLTPNGYDQAWPPAFAALDAQGTEQFGVTVRRGALSSSSPVVDTNRVQLWAPFTGVLILDWSPGTVRLTQAQCVTQAQNAAAFVKALQKASPKMTIIVKGMNEPVSTDPLGPSGVPDLPLVEEHVWFFAELLILCPGLAIGSPSFFGEQAPFSTLGPAPDTTRSMMLAWALAFKTLGVQPFFTHVVFNTYPSFPSASIGLTPTQYGALIADAISSKTAYAKQLWPGMPVTVLEWAPNIGESGFNPTTYAEYTLAGWKAQVATGHNYAFVLWGQLAQGTGQPIGDLDQDGWWFAGGAASSTGKAIIAAFASP